MIMKLFCTDEDEKAILEILSNEIPMSVLTALPSFDITDEKKAVLTSNNTRTRTFLCPICGNLLSGLTALNRHLVIHSGNRPFNCKICGKSFTQAQRLKVHQRTHSGERPYMCSLCSRSFVESCKLKRHLASVHNIMRGGKITLFAGPPQMTPETNATYYNGLLHANST